MNFIMEKAMSKELTYKDVWNTLSKVDCSEHIEKKMNLSFLSWSWAWSNSRNNNKKQRDEANIKNGPRNSI